MRPCTCACRTCCPSNGASPSRMVRRNGHRLDATASRPRMFFEHRDGELAVTEVALVTAVGEARGQLPQVTFADWLAAQRAGSLWTGPPAVHQYEFHMSPPLEESPALGCD